MTHVELRDLLVNRIGWLNSVDSPFVVDAMNQTTESGRNFQDEHPMVKLSTIKAVMSKDPADALEFNAFLGELRRRCVLLVIADIFEVHDLQDDLLEDRTGILDNAILKRMALLVGETILSSTRSNRTESMTKEQMQNIFYEINGNANPAVAPIKIGLRSRYENEIGNVKARLGQAELLDTSTFRLPNYENEDYFFYE